MKSATLIRSYLPDRTVGKLIIHHNNEEFKTLELPDKNNKVNISCIPTGNYRVNRDTTGRHQYYRFDNVIGRTSIEIHIANKIKDLLGCIGLGMAFDGKYNLLNSSEACKLLLSLIGDEDFMLCIRDYNSNFDNWS
jgi:hypothetical protein